MKQSQTHSDRNDMDAQQLVSTREAAAMLCVSQRTIQLWAENGVLRAWKTSGGHRRILKNSIDEILASREQEIASRRGDSNLKVLVISEDAGLLEAQRAFLLKLELPLKLTLAPNGFEALLNIGKSTPDIIILDLELTSMDGISLLHALEKASLIGQSKVLVISDDEPDTINTIGGLPDGVRLTSHSRAPIDISSLLRSLLPEARGTIRSPWPVTV